MASTSLCSRLLPYEETQLSSMNTLPSGHSILFKYFTSMKTRTTFFVLTISVPWYIYLYFQGGLVSRYFWMLNFLYIVHLGFCVFKTLLFEAAHQPLKTEIRFSNLLSRLNFCGKEFASKALRTIPMFQILFSTQTICYHFQSRILTLSMDRKKESISSIDSELRSCHNQSLNWCNVTKRTAT